MALPAQEPAVACREMIAIVRRLLSGEKVDFTGQRYTLRGAQLQVPPAPVEVWVIGRGRQMVRMAGECADVAVVTSQLNLEATVGSLRSAAAEAGRPLRTAALNNMAFTQAVIDQMRPHYTYVLPNSPPAVQQELGLSPEWVAELKRVRETDGVEAAARLISDDLLRRNMVLGTSAECAEQLHQLGRRWGFSHFIMPIMTLDPEYALPAIREAASIFAHTHQLLSEGENQHGSER
jgi:alkanesulfonate monooxygenase SsuD/methylene tetrahydromethanopterin reductase-like flavin-dependent oxidoreductase (luciferase family)